MARTKITMNLEVADEDHDPDDKTGLTAEAYERIFDELSHEGYEDIEFERLDS